MKNIKHWTTEEDLFLKENYNVLDMEFLCSKFNCNKNQILYRLKKLNITFYNRYEDWEIQIIKNNANLENKEIQERFLPHRTIRSIETQFNKLNIKKIRGRQWKDDEIKLFISLYPNSSFMELTKIFKNLTKSEYNWMRDKYNLKQSKEKEHERRKQNGTKCKSYWTNEKEKYLTSLINNYPIDQTIKLFQKKYKQSSSFLLNKLESLGLLSEEFLYKYQRIDLKYKKLNLNDAFIVYKKMLKYDVIRTVCFTKEQTIFLFKYWLRVNNIKFSKNNILGYKKFKDIFVESKLANSISKNFQNYYYFIQCLFPQYNILPWELQIQVPNQYWKNKTNLNHMIREGIKNLIKDNVIKTEIEVIGINYELLRKYFNTLALRLNGRNMFVDYLLNKNIKVDKALIRQIDNEKFDSIEEMNLFKYLKRLGLNVSKVERSNKLHNDLYNENYIPDFYIQYKNKKIIVEYFGLYFPNNHKSKIINNYVNKTNRKIQFYNSKFEYFLDLYPDDLKNNFEGVKEKLTSFLFLKFNERW